MRVPMELFRSFLRNTRKPEGFLGKCMVASMNYAHAALADWGLGCLPKTGPVRIAELGCGGGRNIRALLRKYPAATVTALDYSEISVEKGFASSDPATFEAPNYEEGITF